MCQPSPDIVRRLNADSTSYDATWGSQGDDVGSIAAQSAALSSSAALCALHLAVSQAPSRARREGGLGEDDQPDHRTWEQPKLSRPDWFPRLS